MTLHLKLSMRFSVKVKMQRWTWSAVVTFFKKIVTHMENYTFIKYVCLTKIHFLQWIWLAITLLLLDQNHIKCRIQGWESSLLSASFTGGIIYAYLYIQCKDSIYSKSQKANSWTSLAWTLSYTLYGIYL